MIFSSFFWTCGLSLPLNNAKMLTRPSAPLPNNAKTVTWPFLTNSVQISRTISCFYPPNPVGFCFSHSEVPGNSCCLSRDLWRVPSPDEYVISFAFLKDNWQKQSGVGNDWGCGTRVFIALKSGRKGWAEMWPWRWSFSDLQRFSGDAVRRAVCAPVVSLPPSAWPPLPS